MVQRCGSGNPEIVREGFPCGSFLFGATERRVSRKWGRVSGGPANALRALRADAVHNPLLKPSYQCERSSWRYWLGEMVSGSPLT